MTTSKTLGDALPEEIERCIKLLEIYKSLGPVGQFGYVMIKADIDRAINATAEGDTVGMLRAYEALKEVK